jgi:hypothetical protein
MPIRTPTTKFFVALTDYLRDQTEHFMAEELDHQGGYKRTLKTDTQTQRLNTEQREHIKALAENLVPAMYFRSVLSFIPDDKEPYDGD